MYRKGKISINRYENEEENKKNKKNKRKRMSYKKK